MEIMDHRGRQVTPPVPAGWRLEGGHDQVVVLRGVSWEQYTALDRAKADQPRPAIAYLDGELELVTTSTRHELVKKLLARLIEAFAEERRLRLDGFGDATVRNKRRRAGAEPDEWYRITRTSKVPDLVIEVVFTSGGIDKLEVYRRLGVAEVWCWIDGKIWMYRLVDGAYAEATESRALEGIDLDRLERVIAAADEESDQTALVRAYRRSLAKR